jgi:transposase
MASPYSDDLRRKLLGAHQRQEGSLAQLAKRFDVSLGWAKKVSAALRATGKMERTPGRPRGRHSKITPEIQQALRDWIAQRADLTLAELQLRLWEQRGLELSIGRLWTALRELGLVLKKSRSTPPSRTRRRASSRVARGASRPARSTRRR